jgi:putative ABC transport system permease protein
MDTLLQDVRYGLRILRRARGFTVLVILVVALGVGAATTIFSIVETALLWKENPNVDRWVLLWGSFPRKNLRTFHFSPPELVDFRGLTDIFESVGAASGFNGTIYIDGLPEFVQGTYVTADMIPMTGIAPISGRAFTAADDRPGAPGTTVLTYEIWQKRLHGDPGIVGTAIRINNEHYTVIGIMPPHYGLWGGDLYLPFQLNPSQNDRANRHLRVVALIRKGVSFDQVNARLQQFARTLERDYAGANPEYEAMGIATWNIREAVVGGVKPLLMILLGVVALIVAISCANIANLLLARASGRRREMALRAAIGAPRTRIVRQLLTESLTLSLAGGAAGALSAAWAVPAAVSLIGEARIPYANLHTPTLDARALLLAIAVASVMGVLFGLAPIVHSAWSDLSQAIRSGSPQAGSNREARSVRAALLVSQIALAMVVLVGAGLTVRTYRQLFRLDLGYDTRDALMASLALPGDRYPTADKTLAFYRTLLDRLASAPGIRGAAVATGRPLMDRVTDVATQDFSLAGREGDTNVPNADLRIVSPQYFEVVGIRLLRGRLPNDNDTPQSEPVAVINQTMATLYWPGRDPVGQTIRLGPHYSSEPDASVGRLVKIVGVVSDARQVRVVDVPVRQEIFFPLAQRAEMAHGVVVIVRSHLATEGVTNTLRQTVAALDPDRPLFDVVTLDQAVADSFATKRLAMVLLGFFAAVAVALASVGLYGTMAYAVSQRTREIGIRMALGAQPRDVLRMIVGEGSRLALTGLALGILSALAATRLMRSLVFEVSTTDPATFAMTGGLLAAVALAASYLPARRATRVDPLSALRIE